MSTINFVPKPEVDKTQLLKVRRTVVVATTGVLAVYLVAVAGIIGWWWYKSTQQKKTSTQIEAYLVEMKNYSQQEVLARRLYARAEAVTDFMTQRGNASAAAEILVRAEDVEPTAWIYTAGGQQEITVKAEGPSQLFSFFNYLREKYQRVQPDEVGWSVTEGWYGRFLASSMKKTEI